MLQLSFMFMYLYTEGPYLISSEVNEEPVFWKVEHSNGSYQLVGTESAADACFFYIIPTGDLDHPCDFHIAYWTKKRQYHMHIDDLYRTDKKRGPPLPHYLTFDRKCTLSLEASVEIKQARFSLHSRVQSSFAWMMCTSTPVSLHSWLEGEQFYIRCCHHSILKTNGYVAVKKNEDESKKEKEDESNCYRVTTVFSVVGKKSSEIGMLFRLHPGCLVKEKAVKDQDEKTKDSTQTTSAPAAVEQSSQSTSAPVAVEQSSKTNSPPVNTALLTQLLIPAAYIGTAAVILYVVTRLLIS